MTATTGFSGVRGCSSRAAGATGGLTTTVPAGGVTTTTGRVGAATLAGALAITGPAGGREAMAGAEGGAATIGGAERGCGTILRGSGRGGAAAGGAATTGAGGLTGGAVTAGRAGACTCRASSSASFFLARIAFITSPGLEMCDRSIFGVIVCWPREDAPPADEPGRSERANCARTLSASSASSELECVLPAPRPSSASTSRI